MVEFFEYFSTGEYGQNAEGPVPVELFINGDYFDFLNVPYHGEFVDAITEEVALYKCEAILKGHPEVMDALRRFVSLPGKTITYLIGNHDAELFFDKVRERITKEWDPEGNFPSEKVRVIADCDRVRYPEGLEIHHGNQFEAGNLLNFEKPLLASPLLDAPILNLPWGSFYILKIINRLRWERDNIDKVRPVKVFILFGLILDPWFTLKFCFLTSFYFVMTRLVWSPKRRSRIKVTLEIMRQELKLFKDLEAEARDLLTAQPETKAIIFGHTHWPMSRVYPDGKQYLNTGTWTKMIHLDWRGMGQKLHRTFAHVHFKEGEFKCELRQWNGVFKPHSPFNG